MDIKLPSELAGRNFWREHAEFLQVASQSEVFVKIVLSNNTTQAEMERALSLITGVSAAIPLILQPVTPINGVLPINPDQVLRWQEFALSKLRDVRVIPQTHKIMGQL